MNLRLCFDATPSLLNFFDLSVAPPLLLYSYIPIFFLCIGFGLFIYSKDNASLLAKHFLGITLSFAVWILVILIQWVAVYLEVVHLAWQLLILPEISIFIFSLLFAYSFLFQKLIPSSLKYFVAIILVASAIVLPTRLNIDAFDPVNCEGVVGIAWPVIYIFEWVCISAIILIAIKKLNTKNDSDSKLRTTLFTSGLAFFLAIFWGSNYFGELTQNYEINLIGPIGMFMFLGVLMYMIMKFRLFNTKLFSSQILVAALWIFVAALLFIQRLEYIHIVVIFTLVLVTILGYSLIQSVKKEIKQREKVEKLAVDLEKANTELKDLDRQKDELLSIVSHQLATPVSSIKWYTEMLIDGDVGKVTKEQKEHFGTMMSIAANLSDLVSMILDVSRIQLGRMHIEKQELDLTAFFKEILEIIIPKAQEKKVKLDIKLPAKLPKAMLDRRYTHMTIENLLSNAVKYTPTNGLVNFKVEIKGKTLFCEVRDTGVGIPKSEQGKIFGRMFRASNVRNEIDGNGFGLYVAKGAVEAQGGKIGFKSEEGKGTTFSVELPINSK